tara:strand:+ start:292 stop:648 length:357 start_codon:yes stop_codon:yes gene_type:complete
MEYSQNKQKSNYNLPNTIKNITFFFIKKYYLKYLEDNKLNTIPDTELKLVVSNLYNEKQTELKNYIRGTMRKNFPNYDQDFTLKTGTEQIILEMFEDDEFSKNRLILEIKNYQDGKKH